MNQIKQYPLSAIGYQFIDAAYIPKGEDEYYLRNRQNRSGIPYRELTAFEIEILVRNNNTSDNWNRILVSDAFNPELVKNCKFFGLVRIGKLEPLALEFHSLRYPVGLYNSTIISSDIGDNVVVSHVNYLSHYIIGNECILVNINELATTATSKFGNGIIKEGESEHVRIWLELCNENAGRKVMPFNGMLPGDAFIWAKYQEDSVLQEKFKQFTQQQFDTRRGYYGKIGDRCVIKNCRIIKDVWIGSDAYIKGANKIKNVTILSQPEAPSQIGEGCELVNGIISEGCRVFYGVKAVRFVMASHSQLKYGARLINSYLGNNSTISCCEVLNSLIYPAHEQHHNNSFLCAALVKGQSNMAAGATIGSNHNSRGADGELVAGRGFWPGLCVSLKHNSRFACFNILAKGDYPHELDIPFPFALISNDVSNNRLVVMPAYWFLYNLYAIARNEWKYQQRDQRIEKVQRLEFDSLAPDTAQEILDALNIIESGVYRVSSGKNGSADKPGTLSPEARKKVRQELSDNPAAWQDRELEWKGMENSSRRQVVIKVGRAWSMYRKLLRYYAATQWLQQYREQGLQGVEELNRQLPSSRQFMSWMNIGGQLIREEAFLQFRRQLQQGRIRSWDDVHAFYIREGNRYELDKAKHAWQVLRNMDEEIPAKPDAAWWKSFFQESLRSKQEFTAAIQESRAKDYRNTFRKMVYDSVEEMEVVLGRLEDNSFLAVQNAALEAYEKEVRAVVRKLK